MLLLGSSVKSERSDVWSGLRGSRTCQRHSFSHRRCSQHLLAEKTASEILIGYSLDFGPKFLSLRMQIYRCSRRSWASKFEGKLPRLLANIIISKNAKLSTGPLPPAFGRMTGRCVPEGAAPDLAGLKSALYNAGGETRTMYDDTNGFPISLYGLMATPRFPSENPKN